MESYRGLVAERPRPQSLSVLPARTPEECARVKAVTDALVAKFRQRRTEDEQRAEAEETLRRYLVNANRGPARVSISPSLIRSIEESRPVQPTPMSTDSSNST
jgi:hypothetical protein